MNSGLLRTLVIYAVILPLAVLIGWMAVDLADWDRTSFAVFAAIMFVLLLPALLKWHYPVMVVSWSTFITIFFLPGQPGLWMLMAAINFGIAILNRIIQKRPAFISAPSITLSLLALAAVVIITAQLHGGMGMKILGSASYGGKAYYFILIGIVGYFAFASQPIPPERAKFYARLFFLSGMITAGSTLIYYAGPSFYFLFLVFPVGFAAVQALTDTVGGIARIAGLTVAASACSYYLLSVHGIRGVLQKWWRILLLLVALGLGTLGGYRSTVILFVMVVGILFMAEGLLRSPIFPALLLVGCLGFALLLPISTKLPLPMQRSLSFLPMKVDSRVRADADGSIDWRLEIWRALLPDLPKYFWLGKGYEIDPTDIFLTNQAILRSRAQSYEGALLVGDYHSGPLSVYVPFGFFGMLAFVVFLGAAIRGLYRNYRYGREELRTINRFMFAFFCARVIFFFVAFGGLSGELYVLTGLIGLSVALNNGICRKPEFVPKPVRFRGNLELRPAQPGAV